MSNEHEFFAGFAAATGLSINEAREQWAAWSRQLGDAERTLLERMGYEKGEAEGRLFAAMFLN